jgi:hypothetical protein
MPTLSRHGMAMILPVVLNQDDELGIFKRMEEGAAPK